ncbi:ABC transporter substrate-binding protein [Paenibacillus thiaminolyticus]|uniref:Extracellular solute-binding protein n=1 Tax=Paenibacillus thiaminolyticus TaxID=49283 RepID=A0A3A3GIL6_PANTH|nr:ABC transporter substrate-binding protein [Paenibacillus thiaminolyticus]RJG23987.1 extracellular solute-binding protein [Paenibacillus thiaminolyticus]
MRWKRWSTACLVAVMTLSLVLTACSGSGGNASGTNDGGQASESIVTPKGTYPIVEEKVTLKVMIPSEALVENFETNEFTKWYEEKTNVHVEWIVVPQQSASEKLNLMLASGDYPDVIMRFGVTPAQQMIYGNQGVFLPLNDLIEQYGDNFKKVLDSNTGLSTAITAPDGNIYALPSINDCYHCSMAQKMWIYKPWLDKLGLDVPTTTDELYTVLKAFKEKDPNGNGKADEVPLTGAPRGSGWYSSIDAFLMNSFVLNPVFSQSRSHMYVEDGRIQVAFDKPGWRDGLAYMNKLYKEGLIDPQIFTQDSDQLLKLGEASGDPIVGAAFGGHQGVFTQIAGESGRWLDYVTVPPLKGPNGVQYAAYDPFGYSVGSYLITKNAKHPDVAFRWADGFYDEEVSLRTTIGRPDEEWREAKEGEIGINGKPAKWAKLKEYGQIQNVHWEQTAPTNRSNELRLSSAVPDNGEPSLEVILYNETKNNYDPYKPSADMAVPQLFFTDEQAAELSDLSKTINDYVDEMMARFVIGDADLEKDWDIYLQTLEGMNLPRFLEIYQTAFDSKK